MNIIGLHKCHICSIPFEFDMGDKAICEFCQQDKPKFNRTMAFCTYDGAVERLVVNLKFGDGLHLAKPMAKMMYIMGEDLVKKADIIAPVPLHFRRKLYRRYNQASLLGRNIAIEADKNYQPFLLKRTRHTKQQTRLPKHVRKINVAGAFVANKNINVHGKNILLVDDVMTTGATLSSCAKVLKEAGAKRVNCLVFARVLAY